MPPQLRPSDLETPRCHFWNHLGPSERINQVLMPTVEPRCSHRFVLRRVLYALHGSGGLDKGHNPRGVLVILGTKNEASVSQSAVACGSPVPAERRILETLVRPS